jgi:DNA-binding NtrC family response regulator
MADETGLSLYSVLVMDDEEMILSVLRAVLTTRQGFAYHEAKSCARALHAIDFMTFDLVLADLFLPDGYGTRVALEVLDKHPSTKIVMSSGMPLGMWPRDALAEFRKLPAGTWRFLAKPYRPSQALHMVRELLTESEPVVRQLANVRAGATGRLG